MVALNFTAQPLDSKPMPWDRAPEADSTEPPPAPPPWLKSSESANQASVESVETPSTATTAESEISESARQGSVESVETPQAAPNDRAQRLAEAQHFLTALDDEAESWTFQTFDDSGQRRGKLTDVLHGDIDALFNRLDTLNANGAGVYVTVNETDGKGRKEQNIVRVRAVFADFDPPKTAAAPASYPLEPVITVESSLGKHHVYWTVDGLALDDFENQQRGIIAALGSDTQPNDLPRVMRLPGFRHMKDPAKPHLVRIVSTEPRLPYPAAELARAFPPAAKVNGSGKASSERPDTNQDPVVQALSERGLVIGKRQDAAFNIRCPWEDEHTTPSTATSTVYFPPHTGGYEGAAFKCQHEHCRDRTAAELRRVLGLADGPSAEHGAQVAAAIGIGQDADDQLGLHDVERLLAWSWRTGTSLPSARSTGIFESSPAKAGERPLERLRSPIAAHPTHSAPWPKLAWENGADDFLAAAETYSHRRYEKVVREAERTGKPPMDIPADELMVDAKEWLARVRSLDVGDDEGLALLEQARPEWPEPEPLPEGLPAVAPFDPAMLPGALRPWISDIAERMQCPADFPAAASVVCLAAVVGRQVAIRPKRHDDWTVVPNLWGAIIGRPSLLKSPALAEPMRLVDGLEGKARATYEDAIREYKAQARVDAINNKLADQDIQKALKAGDKSKALDMAFDVSSETEVPARRRYRTSDATIEKLGELLTANPRGLMLFRDELVGFLRSLDKEGREGSRAFFLEAWNGNGGFTFDRIGRGTVEIEAACLSLLGGIQPGPLTAYLTETLRGGAGDDGLLQRFQVTVWPDPPATWRNVDRRPDASARQAARDVFERLDAIDPATIGAAQDDEDALPWLRFDDEAQELFDDWRADLEQRLRAGDLPVALEAHLAKYRSLLPSLALLFHLADNAQGRAVGKPSLLRARAWCEYLETHANRLFAPALAPDLFAAIELDKHLAELDEPFTAKDVYRNHWRGLDREGTALALSVLEDFGRIRGEKSTGPGRPTTLYRINPALQEGME